MIIYQVFTDGGSRGNPGPAATGVVIYKSKQIIYQQGKFIGLTTNNVAEYRALIDSINWFLIHRPQVDRIDWFLDSKLVVEQINRRWRVKDSNLLQLAQQAWSKLDQLGVAYHLKHVLRGDNQAADAMVNQALDNQALK